MWWWLIFGSVLSLAAIPCGLIYDTVRPWREAKRDILKRFPESTSIWVGAGSSQRSYILLPQVFSTWSIVSVTEQDDGQLDVHEESYAFILYLMFWVPWTSFGVFYSLPKIMGRFKKSEPIQLPEPTASGRGSS